MPQRVRVRDPYAQVELKLSCRLLPKRVELLDGERQERPAMVPLPEEFQNSRELRAVDEERLVVEADFARDLLLGRVQNH